MRNESSDSSGSFGLLYPHLETPRDSDSSVEQRETSGHWNNTFRNSSDNDDYLNDDSDYDSDDTNSDYVTVAAIPDTIPAVVIPQNSDNNAPSRKTTKKLGLFQEMLNFARTKPTTLLSNTTTFVNPIFLKAGLSDHPLAHVYQVSNKTRDEDDYADFMIQQPPQDSNKLKPARISDGSSDPGRSDIEGVKEWMRACVW